MIGEWKHQEAVNSLENLGIKRSLLFCFKMDILNFETEPHFIMNKYSVSFVFET
jgi:hypothetical protein